MIDRVQQRCRRDSIRRRLAPNGLLDRTPDSVRHSGYNSFHPLGFRSSVWDGPIAAAVRWRRSLASKEQSEQDFS